MTDSRQPGPETHTGQTMNPSDRVQVCEHSGARTCSRLRGKAKVAEAISDQLGKYELTQTVELAKLKGEVEDVRKSIRERPENEDKVKELDNFGSDDDVPIWQEDELY